MRPIDADKLKQDLLDKSFYPAIVARAIDNAPTVNHYEWISVKDRLPEKSGTYLVHYHDDIIGEYVITREYWAKQRKFAPMEYFEEHTSRKAMHWMPLPAPPTEKEN